MGLAILARSLSRFRLQHARYHADADMPYGTIIALFILLYVYLNNYTATREGDRAMLLYPPVFVSEHCGFV